MKYLIVIIAIWHIFIGGLFAQTTTNEIYNISVSPTATPNGVLSAVGKGNVKLDVNNELEVSVGSSGTFIINGGPTQIGNFSGTTPDPNKAANLLVQPAGTNNNIGHLEAGNYGFIDGTAKWLGLGSAPASLPGPAVYGQRVQWNDHFGIFNLREVNSTTKDLVVQWGGTTSNNRLRFEYASSGTATPQTFAMFDSDGNFGVGNVNPDAPIHIGTTTGINSRLRLGSIEYFEDGGPYAIKTNAAILPTTIFATLGSPSHQWTNIFSVNPVTVSDRRLKKNIANMTYGLKEVMQLRPVTYQWKDEQLGTGTTMGLIAQEVEQVMAEAVYNPANHTTYDENGQPLPLDPNARMGIEYNNLIPVLIAAIQEQQEQIKKLNRSVRALKQGKSSKSTNGKLAPIKPETTPASQGGAMIQNYPNPFNESTTIQYNVPEGTGSAQLVIYDLNGQQVRSFTLNPGTKGAVQIEANTLAKDATAQNMYIYALVLDGVTVASKKMAIE